MSTPPQKKRRFGEILVDAGVVTEVQLQAALQEQRKWGGKLGRTLVEMGFLDEPTMVLALSRQLQLPTLDLDKATIPKEIVRFLRVDLAERYGVFPVSGDESHKTVTLATSDPTNMEQIQEISFRIGQKVQVAVAAPSAIDRAIRRYYYGEATVSTATARPQDLGVDEATFELETSAVPPPKAAAPPPPAAAPAAAAPAQQQLTLLTEKVGALERVVASQVKVIRGLLELMLEKGLISRDEYLAKVRRDG